MGFFYNTYREWWEGVKVGILWFPSKANLWSAIERSLSHYKKQCETSWDAIQAQNAEVVGPLGRRDKDSYMEEVDFPSTSHPIDVGDSSLLNAPSFGQLAGLSVPWTVLWTWPLDRMMCLRHSSVSIYPK
ncbi:hypothetical protein ACE6H2_013281 [Prunus campanulata]